MEPRNKYIPINCAFHDYLEHFATLRQPVNIVYNDEVSLRTEIIQEAVIFDLTGGRDGEFTHVRYLEGEKKIRNDYLISVDGIKLASLDENSCRI